jgi:hypothetical protein
MSERTTRISNLPKQESLSVFTQLHFHTVYSTTNTERLPKCRNSTHSTGSSQNYFLHILSC